MLRMRTVAVQRLRREAAQVQLEQGALPKVKAKAKARRKPAAKRAVAKRKAKSRR